MRNINDYRIINSNKTEIVPDIEVELDLEEYESTGRDTQLERAIEFIRKGK